MNPSKLSISSLSSLALLSALVTWERDASAQSCSPTNISVSGVVGPVVSVGAPAHTNAVPVNAINLSDCVNDETLQFTLATSGTSANTLQVWAGTTDCGLLTARTGANPTCWPVTAGAEVATSPLTMTIRARDIVSQMSASTKVATYAAAPASVCQTAQTTDAASTFSLYMFVVDPSLNVCGSEITYPVTVDLAAGDVAGAITTTPGNESLTVHIPATTDPDIAGWSVYVDPPPGTNTAVPSSASVCASSVLVASTASTPTNVEDGGVSFPGDGGAPFVQPTVNVPPAQYLGAQAGASVTSVVVPGLTNGVTYTVAVAATDALGNVGPLTLAPCGDETMPLPGATTPNSDGGVASGSNESGSSGGSCAIATAVGHDGDGAPVGTAALGLGWLAAVASIVRKRRGARG